VAAAADFPAAQAAVAAALRADGLDVTVVQERASFARLAVSEPASAFEPYMLTADQVEALYVKLLAWAEEIEAGTSSA
jgi:hypothetical protein